MGINSVNGQGAPRLLPNRVNEVPASTLRTADETAAVAPETPPVPARDTVQTSEDQAPRPTQAGAAQAPARNAFPRLRIDAETKRVIAQIVDENNEVQRQIPPEQLLRIAAQFRELQGLLFDELA